VTAPEIVACVSAHAAVDKACSLLGIKLIKVPMDSKTYKVLPALSLLAAATTMIAASSASTAHFVSTVLALAYSIF
jgi:sphinganine-1-phosphate aldolase